jgi:hypothetical protein
MPGDQDLLAVLRRHGVQFVVIGGHAVNFHGYARTTEDTDVVWIRTTQSENALLLALNEIGAQYIANEIDPATKIERTYPVDLSYIQASRLMMLWTKSGFLDLFDYVPGVESETPESLLAASIESDGVHYASLNHLRQMKLAAGRTKDRLDLENLPD